MKTRRKIVSECKRAENTGVLQISPEDQCDWEGLAEVLCPGHHGEFGWGVTWVESLLLEVSSFSASYFGEYYQTGACSLLWHLYEVEPNLPSQNPACCKGKLCQGLPGSPRLAMVGLEKTQSCQKRLLRPAPAVRHVGKAAPAASRPRVAGSGADSKSQASPPLSAFHGGACTGAWQV